MRTESAFPVFGYSPSRILRHSGRRRSGTIAIRNVGTLLLAIEISLTYVLSLRLAAAQHAFRQSLDIVLVRSAPKQLCPSARGAFDPLLHVWSKYPAQAVETAA